MLRGDSAVTRVCNIVAINVATVACVNFKYCKEIYEINSILSSLLLELLLNYECSP